MTSPGEETADSSLPSAKHGGSWRRISIYHSSGDPKILDIPESLDSLETLVFCGFDKDIASTFIIPEWERQNALFPEHERTLMDEAMRYMRSKVLDDEDWQASLKALGLSIDLINRIMNPEFEDIREGGTPLFWATDSVKESYDYLKYLFRRVASQSREDITTS